MICATRGENIFDLEFMSDERFPLYSVSIVQCKPPYYLLLFEPTKPRKANQFSSANPTQPKNFEIDLFIITCYILYRSTVLNTAIQLSA
jgi:hypothetical protein